MHNTARRRGDEAGSQPAAASTALSVPLGRITAFTLASSGL